MLQTTVVPDTTVVPGHADGPEDWLARHGGELPVLFFCLAALSARHDRFRRGFPGAVTYAVKANPDEAVIARLGAEGMPAFDVASPAEIALVRRLCPSAALHYHNPVRSRGEIRAGLAAGVASWSVDDSRELEKLVAEGVGPGAEIAVRLKLPVAGAAYDFGSKFGAPPELAEALLRRAAATGARVSMTFHVGTQCADPAAWTAYMEACADIVRRTGLRLARLNVGGGFPSGRDGGDPALEPIFAAVARGLSRFERPPELVCEPGRGLVADAMAYAVRVKARRGAALYLNDGIYGGLSECPSIGVPRVDLVTDDGRATGPAQPFTLFGPTCDSLDRLPGETRLAGCVAEGDWLLFRSAGAYLNGVTTMFNGYGTREQASVGRLWTDPCHPLG
ncbi:ornithine decarboxylase [Limimaricola pyoseonensis]|uniref:ornithine decarboxylase n=1 Tax=Limimaricola pyoseonensis TaxID=521013 RepID=A0A1G7D2L3_9RHOB|nr:ornithine decarboxylase [Limimaricola pyoseonensis]SDE45733.1 ornithine decarboxylase [Limimaricola pyoseonensis]